MCNKSKDLAGWQTNLPDSCGDWLWILQWDCGCILRSGIAYVYEINEEDLEEDKPELAWKSDSGTILCLGWEGQYPIYLDEGPSICYWKKIQLPGAREYLQFKELGFDKKFIRYIKREQKKSF